MAANLAGRGYVGYILEKNALTTMYPGNKWITSVPGFDHLPHNVNGYPVFFKGPGRGL